MVNPLDLSALKTAHDDPHDSVPAGGPTRPADHPHFGKAMNWEASWKLMMIKSERRAWRVAWVAAGFALFLGFALMLLMPLKETLPYLVRVNNATGVPDLVSALDSKGVGYDEALDKYFLARYVTARETYDWYTIQKDYDTVGLMSTANVGKGYAAKFEGKDALDKKYGSTIQEIVKIVSVVPSSRDQGIATVRFIKTKSRTDDPANSESTSWVATISYEYRSALNLRESSRLINPLGFTVLSYRVDPESVGGAQ